MDNLLALLSLLLLTLVLTVNSVDHIDESMDYGSGLEEEELGSDKQISDHRFFLQQIFTKYGHDGQMTFEGFEHLLESLGLGNVIIKDHDLMAHKVANDFQNTHPSHEHFKNQESDVSTKREARSKFELPLPKHRTNMQSTLKPDLGHTHDDHNDLNHHHHHHVEDRHDGAQHKVANLTRKSESSHSHSDHNDHHRHEEHVISPSDAVSSSEEVPELLGNITELSDEHKELAEWPQKGNVKLDCLSPLEILMTFDINPQRSFNHISFLHMCPAIIYELDQRHCFNKDHDHEEEHKEHVTIHEWLYATVSVVLISLCGLFSVAVIPIMQKWFYQTLLQFLVGLAIGSLSGDALLHLMPHAMLSSESKHEHSQGIAEQDNEEFAVWRGMMALGGIYFFFVAERLLSAFTLYRRKKLAKLAHGSKAMIPSNSSIAINQNVGEKLSQYRKNSYGVRLSLEGKEETETLHDSDQPPAYNEASKKDSSRRPSHEVAFHGRSSFSVDPEPGVVIYQPSASPDTARFEIGVSEHHGHEHGHSHEVPQSVSAVAWMVIMGDGLHNFCDGLAIGAAFASGVAGGISTTVAVFCHELPHELGDFAMLLKTGMKVKQALMYNGLSSVLCFIGMIIGVSLGNMQSATTWIFAGTAGMFIYIALVDMLPELATFTNDPGSTASYTLAVQVLGISTGITVMLLIAIYEHDLKRIVS